VSIYKEEINHDRQKNMVAAKKRIAKPIAVAIQNESYGCRDSGQSYTDKVEWSYLEGANGTVGNISKN
jgi:hypothetical protein